jgi:hypothetical protein
MARRRARGFDLMVRKSDTGRLPFAMKPVPQSFYWLAPALALPPFLLIPFVGRMPGAVFFHDLYEACLWLSPAVGVVVLALLFRRRRRDPGALRSGAAVAAMLLACLDLVSPVFFYVLLALLAGR